MKFSPKWWEVVTVLFVLVVTLSSIHAQMEEPSPLNVSGSSEVQSEGLEAQSSSNELEQKNPTLASNSDRASTEVEIDRRFNELRRELLDDREKTIDWWLTIIVIFLTFLAIIIPIAAVIGGLFGFKKFNEIKEEAQRHLEDIKKSRDKADSLAKGMTAENAGANPQKTIEIVENIQQNPEASPIDRVVAIALSLQQQNRTDEAIEKWRAVALIAEESDNDLAARAWFSVGYLHSNKDKTDFNAVISAFGKALSLKPDYSDAYYNRGVTYGELGQNEAALADYDEAIRLKPNFTEAYNNRGVTKVHLGQNETALTDYDKALLLKPDYADAYNNRGNAKKNLGQYEAALADYDKALRLKPKYADAYNNRAAVQFDLGQYENAFADFDKALGLNPDFAEVYCNRGVAKSKLGHYEAAIADFDEALRLNSDYADAYLSRGTAKGKLGQYERALNDFDKALGLNPDSPEAYNNRGKAQNLIGNHGAALADLDQALRLKPDLPESYYNRGLANRGLHRINEARQDFKMALDLARSTADEDLMKLTRDELENLDKGDT